ncbi:hypothetical protein SAMN04490209_3701 [Pseudomonas rhodesiae]|uniref:Uncharacterized protein n=1 Tax=Pseudomonas rhodesiae TaxID=76760 RepID=A0AAE8L0I4_9PSED|nr:hypothetical protein SAMN04490209_3701 [Pseudomonas rhodesiae]
MRAMPAQWGNRVSISGSKIHETKFNNCDREVPTVDREAVVPVATKPLRRF